MTITKNEAPLINLLKSGVILEQTQELTDKSFMIAMNNQLLYIELISDKSFYVSYKDNMSYKNIVTFTTIQIYESFFNRLRWLFGSYIKIFN